MTHEFQLDSQTYDPALIAKLLRAVANVAEQTADECDRLGRLDEALELAHLSREKWQKLTGAVALMGDMTRQDWGLREDDEGVAEDSTVESVLEFRALLRRVGAALVVRTDDPSVVAAELHTIIFGDRDDAPLTWRDVRALLVGNPKNQPSFAQLRALAELLREGMEAQEAADAAGVSYRQAWTMGSFLGLREWRTESRARAARVAAQEGIGARLLAERYNAGMRGQDVMSEKTAGNYLTKARAALAGEAA